ncbi:hypothetical protein EC957_008458 [Mortierella hygrophila]|uniref:Uncharacterized protein n=1 Tax=Mortierella hygrophila TaxID=979708 RepID=A0A9P6FBD1_9FUNG|nr:hypothetical protein EC957_008458 [Mortierella hygrophila]
MKISTIIALFAVIALVQAAPAPIPAGSGKKIHTEAAAASIASYQDKASGTAPMVASHHKGSGEGAAPMRRKRGLINTDISRNKVCVKAPVKVDAHNVKVLSP